MRIVILLLALGFVSLEAHAQQPASGVAPKTEVISASGRRKLLGKHKFQLHWISWNRWKDFADLRVVDRLGTLVIKGRQEKDGDYLEIDGTAVRVEDLQFTFQGTIVTKVSHKNNGNPCRRDGTMTFKITGKRKYWRLQEMRSPCDETTDYVDIFLRMENGKWKMENAQINRSPSTETESCR